jgi:hypothetical protein
MTEQAKTAEENARNAAAFADRVDHERRMAKFQRGELGYVEAEFLTQKLCAEGDRVKQEKVEREQREAERAVREANARSRGF